MIGGDVKIRQSRVRFIDTDRLLRRQAVLSSPEWMRGFDRGRTELGMRMLELRNIENELTKRGVAFDRYTLSRELVDNAIPVG